MATEIKRIQGEVNENPAEQELEVEKLLAGLLRSLLEEQKLPDPTEASEGQNA